MLADSSIQQFKQQLSGQLIQRNDKEYDAARKIYNAMIDKKPLMIARCADQADVIAAVNFGRENKLLIAIRGGGHNGGGLSICDDGLVIDLSMMKTVKVDATKRTVTAGGGCTWGMVDKATHEYGLACPAGIISTTGVGGLTLGGGVGHLSRQCGLTIDNLLGAEVVLADGSVIRASAKENQDLFWALRGGGGNFGIVTSFTFQLHEINNVYAGPMLWELNQAPEIMRWYRDFIKDAPEDINGFFLFLIVPPGPPFPEHLHLKNMCGIVWSHTGTVEEAEKAFAPIRKKFPPALDLVGPLPYPALQSMFDALYPPGHQWYWRADYVNELSDELIEAHMQFGSAIPTIQSSMHLYPVNGRAAHPGNNDTAWSYRDAIWAQVIVGVDPDPANKEKITKWTKDYWEATHPFSAGGAYVNFMMDEGAERVKATYRDNYDKLAAIKSKYDPNNLFRVNQNIKPAGVIA